MRSQSGQRVPTPWIILFALLGIVVSIAIGRVIAVNVAAPSASRPG